MSCFMQAPNWGTNIIYLAIYHILEFQSIQVDYVSSSHPFVAVHFILECGAKLEAEAITISTAARCHFLGPEYFEGFMQR